MFDVSDVSCAALVTPALLPESDDDSKLVKSLADTLGHFFVEMGSGSWIGSDTEKVSLRAAQSYHAPRHRSRYLILESDKPKSRQAFSPGDRFYLRSLLGRGEAKKHSICKVLRL